MRQAILPLLLVTSIGLANAQTTHLTIYQSDDTALFNASGDNVDAGYAMVHEPRTLQLDAGEHTLSMAGLPLFLDSETLALTLPADTGQVRGQRLLLPAGTDGSVAGWVGQNVQVLSDNGQVLADGVLQRVMAQGLQIADAQGQISVITRYAAVRAHRPGTPGAQLQVQVDGHRTGSVQASLSYATAGLGWHAAYVGTLIAGTGCHLQWESRASVANRSGRDWHDASLKLIAGQPDGIQPHGPRPVMMMARAAAPDTIATPAALDNYRSFTLPGALDLPDGSVSQSLLYATTTVACQRATVIESGNTWLPDKPNVSQNTEISHPQVNGMLDFAAFESLPAGAVRILRQDRDGQAEYIGGGRIGDTPKKQNVHLPLGQVFDLTADRKRTGFTLDRQAHRLDESFQLTLSNAGDEERNVSVREHPDRWHQWQLRTSSLPASQGSPDMLNFQVPVPAHGQATVSYTVRYQWTTQDD